jgi:hypothetical protein
MYLGYNLYFKEIGPEIDVGMQIVKTTDQTIFWVDTVSQGEIDEMMTNSLVLSVLDRNNHQQNTEIIDITLDKWQSNWIEFSYLGMHAVDNDIWIAFRVSLAEQSINKIMEDEMDTSGFENFVFLIKGVGGNERQYSYTMIKAPDNYTVTDVAIDSTGAYIGFSLETNESYYSEAQSYDKTNSFAAQSIPLETFSDMEWIEEFPLITQVNHSIRFDTFSAEISEEQNIYQEFKSYFDSTHQLNLSDNIPIPNEHDADHQYHQIDSQGNLYIQLADFYLGTQSEFYNNVTAYNFVFVNASSHDYYKWLLHGLPFLFLWEGQVIYVTNFLSPVDSWVSTYTIQIGIFNPVQLDTTYFPSNDSVYPRTNLLIPVNEVDMDQTNFNLISLDTHNGVPTLFVAFSGFLDDHTILPKIDEYRKPIKQASTFLYQVSILDLLQAKNNEFIGEIWLVRGERIDENYEQAGETNRENGKVQAFTTRQTSEGIEFVYFITTIVVIPNIKQYVYESALFEYHDIGREKIK